MKIGIDIGGSHIAMATVTEDGKIAKKISEDIKYTITDKEIVNFVDNGVRNLIKDADIDGIGIAAPGNTDGSRIYNLVNLEVDEVDFRKIGDKYNLEIKSINDGKAAAIAEKTYGSLKGIKDCIFLCLGTGIGSRSFY